MFIYYNNESKWNLCRHLVLDESDIEETRQTDWISEREKEGKLNLNQIQEKLLAEVTVALYML